MHGRVYASEAGLHSCERRVLSFTVHQVDACPRMHNVRAALFVCRSHSWLKYPDGV